MPDVPWPASGGPIAVPAFGATGYALAVHIIDIGTFLKVRSLALFILVAAWWELQLHLHLITGLPLVYRRDGDAGWESLQTTQGAQDEEGSGGRERVHPGRRGDHGDGTSQGLTICSELAELQGEQPSHEQVHRLQVT